MSLNKILENKKNHILIFSVIFIVIFWFIEKAREVPLYGAVFYKMGMQCADECSPEKQLNYFRKAVHYDPNLIDAYYQMGLVYEKINDKKKSLEFFQRATEYDHENIIAFYKAGVLYYEQEDYERALRCFLRSRYREGGYPDDTNYYLARIYDHTKECESAMYYYHAVATLDRERIPEVYTRAVELCLICNEEHVIKSYIEIIRMYGEPYYADQLGQIFKTIKDSGTSRQENNIN